MSNHNAVLMADGKVYTWGCNGSGRLGHGDLLKRANPQRLQYFQTVNEGSSSSSSSSSSSNSGGGQEGNAGTASNASNEWEGTPHLVDLEHIIMLARIGYRPVTLREVVLLLREEPSQWLGKQQQSRTLAILETQKQMSYQCRRWEKVKQKLKHIENNIELCITSTVRKLNSNSKRVISGHVDRTIKRYHSEFTQLLSILIMEPGYLIEFYREMVTYNKWEDCLQQEKEGLFKPETPRTKVIQVGAAGKEHKMCQFLELEGSMDMEVIRPSSMQADTLTMTAKQHAAHLITFCQHLYGFNLEDDTVQTRFLMFMNVTLEQDIEAAYKIDRNIDNFKLGQGGRNKTAIQREQQGEEDTKEGNEDGEGGGEGGGGSGSLFTSLLACIVDTKTVKDSVINAFREVMG